MQVWAPAAGAVSVRLTGAVGPVELPLRRDDDGWHRGTVDGLRHGADYALVLDGGEPLPDPWARWLPHGVHEPGRWWDPATVPWSDAGWRGRTLRTATAVYELHIGTFTPGGTLDSAIERLDHLAALGVSHVELLPLAAFDGPRGWGYDGVAVNAVHEAYGGPDALCRFVGAAHARGLAVLLDVVHNHLGPSGNRTDRFGPFTTQVHHTPWGGAVNLDQPGSNGVRALLQGSALGWLRDFHLDGLRLDAVHELVDGRALTFLEELAAAVDALAERVGRPLTLVAESDRNDPRTVTPRAQGGLGLTAQWDDDVHHALHWLVTGETAGYYADFGAPDAVAQTLERVFLHDGRWSSFRGRHHGRPVDLTRTDPWRFVVALQTHDQVGNRATGDRLSQLADPDRLAAAAALLLALPYTPMLFMGEEWGAGTPWQFFTSFPDPELGAAITRGRQAEFAAYGWDAADVPDPQDPATAAASTLDWSEPAQDAHARLLGWYRDLLALRAGSASLGSADAGAHPTAGGLQCVVDGVDADLVVLSRPGATVAANLSRDERTFPVATSSDAMRVALAWPSPDGTRFGRNGLTLAGGATAVLLAGR